MSFHLRISDAVLLFCLGAFTTFASISAYHHLEEVRQAALITKKEKAPDIISQRTEDAIKVETLGALFDSPNYEIRQASIKILVERVMRDDTYNNLLAQVRSYKDPECQTRALMSLRFLIGTSVQDATVTNTALLSVILFLASRNPLSAQRSHFPDTDWRSRPPAEQNALYILDYFLLYKFQIAIQMGLVSRWLVGYPWGGSPAEGQPPISVERKQAIVQKLAGMQVDDVYLAGIINRLVYHVEGRKQLRAAGLLGSAMEEGGKIDATGMQAPSSLLNQEGSSAAEGSLDADGDFVMGRTIIPPMAPPGRLTARDLIEVDGASGVILGGADGNSRRRQRRREESEEEAQLRRRRRQAMVISEGGAPLSRENIFGGVGDIEGGA